MNPARAVPVGGPRNLQSSSIPARSVSISSGDRKSMGAQRFQKKPPATSTRNGRPLLLDCVKEDLYYRWKVRQISERSLAVMFGIRREHVEAVIREQVTSESGKRPDPPAQVIPFPRRQEKAA